MGACACACACVREWVRVKTTDNFSYQPDVSTEVICQINKGKTAERTTNLLN